MIVRAGFYIATSPMLNQVFY